MKPVSVDISEIIPQRPPFVMVDRITDFSEEKVTTELFVKPDNIFVEDGKLLPAGMVENIAQTCAARIGYITWLKGLPIQIGLIGAVKTFNLVAQPQANDTLVTTITVIGEAFGMLLVDAEVSVNGQTMATSEVKIALTDEKLNS